MLDMQGLILNWALRQPGTAALSLLMVGLLFTLQGFRFAGMLLPVTCAIGGFAIGTVGAVMLQFDEPIMAAAVCAGMFGLSALMNFRIGLMIASMFAFAILGQFFCERLGAHPSTMLTATAIFGVIGLCMRWVCLRPLPIIVTSILGALVLTVGFVAGAAQIAPALAGTFVYYAERWSLVTPLFLLMLFVLGYSVQANAQQGDITSGGARDNYHEAA